MKAMIVGTGVLALALAGGATMAQDASPAGNYVTREEYQKLKGQLDTMKQEMDTLRKERAAQQVQLVQANKATQDRMQQEELDKIIDDMQKDIRENRSLLSGLRSGTTRLLIAGDVSAGFTARRGENSTFEATFAPLFLWQINERILFEGALDIAVERNGVGENETATDLTIANMSYLVNNNLAITAGLFVVPFSTYHLHFDPPWINKFPDDPLAFGGNAIAPSSEIGVMGSGGILIGGTRLTYALYVTNGPSVITDDPSAAGSLDFDNFTDLNNDKAVGGRVGFLPIPELEVGYSLMRASVNPESFTKNVNALLMAGDANYVKELDWLRGTITLRAEWVWSNVEDVTYHPAGSSALRFDNDRNGGYATVAYRPTKADSKVIRNLEFAVRYDSLDVSRKAPDGDFEQRWTFGIDYWLAPNAVIKFAYQVDDKDVGEDQNAFLIQFGLGL